MASSSSLFSLKLPFINILLILASSTPIAIGHFTSIFSFGDSLADTGNLLLSYHADKTPHFFLPPYGDTFFHRPTGRCSDGRLIIDFIAESLGLPLVQPYLEAKNGSGRNFQKGVNFAVAGATALDAAFFEERGIRNPYTNSSLGTQLGWFKEMLPLLCQTHTSSSCSVLLGSSLFLLGEIGGNDYNYPFFMRRSIEEILAFVPRVIYVISSAINELIELGVTTIVVPGNLPIGCSAAYLTLYESSNKEEYDPITGCLNWLNKFAEYHNEELQKELNRIQKLQPHASIIYADYYNAAMGFYRSPSQFGFSIRGAVTACCGGGGPYNYNKSAECGYPPASTCDDPSSYVSWDGLHLTEAAYRWISNGLLQGLYTIPSLNTSFVLVL